MNNWFEHILFHLRTQPERPAMVMEDRVVTYGMLQGAIDNCAHRIAGLGMTGEAPVAILVANPIRHVALCLALFRVGIPSTSLEHSQSGIADIRFAAVLGDDQARALVNPANRFVEVTDEWFAGSAADDNRPKGFADSAQVCRVNLTSGTTGQPKLIALTVEEIGARIAGFTLTGFTWHSLLCLPGLSSGWAFMAMVATFSAGQTLCFAASPFQAIRMIELFSIDYVLAATEQLLALTRVARKSGAQLQSLRLAEVAGSVPTTALLEAATIYVCKELYCRYGATEFGGVARAPARDVLSRPGFVGHLLPGIEVMIADRNGAVCQSGEVGLIRMRRDQRWNVSSTSGKNGAWVDTGDLGWMSAAGEVYVLGRPSDTNEAYAQGAATRRISPVHEVEHLLRLEWDAADAAAVLVDNEEEGSGLQIWVGTVDCKDARAEKLEGILHACGIDIPVRLFDLKAIPRGVNGKVQRTKLKALMTSNSGDVH